jgi:hypothetical protein
MLAIQTGNILHPRAPYWDASRCCEILHSQETITDWTWDEKAFLRPAMRNHVCFIVVHVTCSRLTGEVDAGSLFANDESHDSTAFEVA